MATHYHQWDSSQNKFVKVFEKPLEKKDLSKRMFNKPLPVRTKAKAGPRKSSFKGVSFQKNSLLWRATIWVDGWQIFLGSYSDEREAALAYDRRAIKEGKPTNILKSAVA